MLALVTGASSGIGKATAYKLAEKGYSLILMARRSDRLQNLKVEIEQKYSVSVHAVTIDIRQISELEKWVNSNDHLLTKLDILINNAGLAKGVAKVQDARLDDWAQMIDTNVNGLIAMTRLLVPFMLQNKKGHIVNMGSVAGRWSYTGGSVYCGTKHFVKAFTEALRQDIVGSSIRVTNIEPGLVETEFSEVRLEDREKAKAVYQGMTPLSAQDIADTIMWCLDRPPHVNIQELVIFPTDQASVQLVHRK